MSDLHIRPILPTDWEGWLPIWRGYHEFYKNNPSEEVTRTTWARFFDPEEPIYAFVAESEGKLLGAVHYLYHRNTWMLAPVCYLQDLFTLSEARGKGVGRQLIEAVYARGGTIRFFQSLLDDARKQRAGARSLRQDCG